MAYRCTYTCSHKNTHIHTHTHTYRHTHAYTHNTYTHTDTHNTHTRSNIYYSLMFNIIDSMKGGKVEEDDDDLDQLLRKERIKEQERKDTARTANVEETLLVSDAFSYYILRHHYNYKVDIHAYSVFLHNYCLCYLCSPVLETPIFCRNFLCIYTFINQNS